MEPRHPIFLCDVSEIKPDLFRKIHRTKVLTRKLPYMNLLLNHYQAGCLSRKFY